MTEDELNLLGQTLSGRALEEKNASDEKEAAQVDAALAQNTASLQQPFVDEDAVPSMGIEQSEGNYEIRQESLILRDRSEQIVVSVEDLDANFEITFVEGGRTPLSDSVMQQNLVALLQPYGALWEAASKGGPTGVFAKNYMKILAERFDLPKDLHPEELDSELALQETETKKTKKPKETKPEEAAPEEVAPENVDPVAAEPEDAPVEGQDPQEIIAQISQMPPDQALAALAEVFGDNPEIMQILEQIASLPEEQQSDAINQVLEAASANL
jgi:hypothetical protein